MRSLVRVAERGSFSAVARELGIGQSTVTRHVRELEDALGVRLLSRTTRRVSLTEEGRRYYASSVQVLRLVDQATDEVRSGSEAPAGTVRISCTAAFGVLHLCPMIFAFQDLFPEIGIDLSLTDDRIDLVREGVDVAVRLGPLTDSAMKLRSLGMSPRILVAAPQYLAERGRPDESVGSCQARRRPHVERRGQRHVDLPSARRSVSFRPVRRPSEGRSRAGCARSA
jgi:DNA-binding transcriptional LysR family regulator